MRRMLIAVAIVTFAVMALTTRPTISGNQVIVRLSLDKANAAVGYNVTGTTSTATEAIAQILLGTDATDGLLLAADTATGSDFRIVP